MKKLKILIFLLTASLIVRAQFHSWQVKLPPDPLVRSSWDEAMGRPPLDDTLPSSPARYYFEREWQEKQLSDGGREIAFSIETDNDWIDRECYSFPFVIWRPLTSGIRFESDWSVAYARPGSQSIAEDYPLCDGNDIHVRQDTVITIVYPFSAGGITPEGRRFRFWGDSVERIEARVSYVYTASQAIMTGVQDNWGVPLGQFSSPWIDCKVARCSYQLPLAEKLSLDEAEFSRLKRDAIRVQRRFLVERRDSVIAAMTLPGYGDWVSGVLDEWQARLKPDFESASTLRELSIDFELDHLLAEITLYLPGGQTRRYVHWAGYETDIP